MLSDLCCSERFDHEVRERDLLRYTRHGHGCIFSCTVILFHPQVCEKVFKLGIDRANKVELRFAPPPFKLFLPSDGSENVSVAFIVEQALAAISCTETFESALLML